VTADEIIAALDLQPHPEGGFYRETFRDYAGPDGRARSTAIYYLLEADTFSEMHLLRSDEVFHFYAGDPVEMLQLLPDGSGRTIVIGSDLARGQQPQVLVDRGVWQGSRLVAGGEWALLGCTVSPGFEYEDYDSASRDELTARWPSFAEMIASLTHS